MPLTRNTADTSRRDAILEAADKLFRGQGYSATSMRQIARAAGYGKAVAGLYSHFESKKAIFAALLECRAPYDELLPALKAIEGDTAEDFVRSLLRTVVPIMHRRRAFLQLVLIDVQEFEGRTLASFLQTVAPRFLGVMLRLTSFPEVRADLSPSLIMRTSVSVGYLFTEIMADTTLMEGLPFPPVTGEAWLDGLVSILVHGLAADAEAKPCPPPEHTWTARPPMRPFTEMHRPWRSATYTSPLAPSKLCAGSR